MNPELPYDYTTVGHVTVDVLADGSRRPGGTAFYSALQAARLGRRALIRTRGAPRELEALLEPYRRELEVEIDPARQTTTLDTSRSGSLRTQRVLAWAGPLAEDLTVDTSILHLAPVARETPTRWRGHAEFVGLTPQGLARDWAGPGGEISLTLPTGADERLAEGCRAIVVSDHERASCEGLIAAAGRAGAVVAVTAGAAPNTILLPDGGTLELDVPELPPPHDDLGAGDVFAAAFFIALAEGQAPERAAAFANAAAAVRMQGTGADAIGGRPAIEARLHAAAGSPG
ncbi:MAG TPA: PfkB family carbohydrate kinase [Solirubrobacteraceae bacterium]|nr:PfkB family carbohydrate kinase [Solirubrobacteraceae bacterium]